MAALGARKAFDRVSHLKLFEKLIARGFPACIVKVLMDWYGKTFSCVKYGDCYSGTLVLGLGLDVSLRTAQKSLALALSF